MKKLLLLLSLIATTAVSAQEWSFNKLEINGTKFIGKAYSTAMVENNIFTLRFDHKKYDDYTQTFLVEKISDEIYKVNGSDKLIISKEGRLEITGIEITFMTLGGISNEKGSLIVYKK